MKTPSGPQRSIESDCVMVQVIVDPDQLRVFATRLLEEAKTLRQRSAAIESNRDVLEGVWRDKRYEEFERAYVPALQGLEKFCREAEEYAKYLRRKADVADRYLRR